MTPNRDDRLDHDDFDEFSHESFEDEMFSSIDSRKDAPAQKSNLLIIVVILAVAAGVAFLLFDSFASETYFYEVDQAVAKGDSLIGKDVRVKGIVEPGSVVGKDGQLGREFRITEKGKSIKVIYNKAMPDTFKEDMEVVVQGKLNEEMVLVADEVMVKCPSRYEGLDPSQHPANIPMHST